MVAATGAAVVAVAYLLIGVSAIHVVEDQQGTVPPMLVSALLFAGLTVALARAPRRGVIVAGIALQILVIVGYLAVAAERTPAFEAWGIAIKVVQVALVGMLAYLALRPPVTR